jgi:hypothetical protein
MGVEYVCAPNDDQPLVVFCTFSSDRQTSWGRWTRCYDGNEGNKGRWYIEETWASQWAATEQGWVKGARKSAWPVIWLCRPFERINNIASSNSKDLNDKIWLGSPQNYRSSILEWREMDEWVCLLLWAIRTEAAGIRQCGSSLVRQKYITLSYKLEQVFWVRFPNGIVNVVVCLNDMDAFLRRLKSTLIRRVFVSETKIQKNMILNYGYESLHLVLHDRSRRLIDPRDV